MVNNILKYTAILLTILLGAVPSNATHVVGGNLMYECLGDGNYEVTLEFAVDCINGDGAALALDSFATIKIFDATNNLVTGPGYEEGEIVIQFSEFVRLGDPNVACRILEDEVCVQRQIYVDTLNLPFDPGGYLLSFRRCCRNSSLLNIEEPLDTGGTYWSFISPEAQMSCNSAPVFRNWPDTYVCLGEELVFNHSARDIDGDSLVYRLCVPTEGGSDASPLSGANYFPPFVDVSWDGGFDLNNLMGGAPLVIDPQTGIITATPNAKGQYLIGICVDEYRDGVKIGETRRDFEYNVRACTDPPLADFEPSPNPNCAGLDVDFTNNSVSTQGNDLSYEWFFDFPNGEIESTDENPSYTFPEAGLYTVALVTFDGACQDTAFVNVGVSPMGDPTPSFNLNAVICGGPLEVSLTDQTATGQDITSWTWTVVTDSETLTFDSQNPTFELDGNQTITITLDVMTISGCGGTITQTIDVEGQGIDYAIPSSLTVCSGESIKLLSDIPDGVDVSIDPDDDNVILMDGMVTVTGSGTGMIGVQDYSITLENESCTITNVLSLNILESPLNPEIINFNLTQCGPVSVILNPNGDPDFIYSWTASDPNLNFDMDAISPQVQVSQVTTFEVEVTNGDCTAFGSVTVTPQNGVVDTGIQNNIVQCGVGGSIPLNPNGNNAYDYSWTSNNTAATISDPNAVNPIVTINSPTTFTVTISEGDCQLVESVFVNVEDAIDLTGLNDNIIACSQGAVGLWPGADPDLNYQWTSSNPAIDFPMNVANPVVQVTQPTNFTVTVTGNACVETATVTVTPIDPIDLSNLPDQLAACEGSSISLYPGADPSLTYQWTASDPSLQFDETSPNPTVAINVATTFTLTAFDNGCTETASVTVSVSDGPDAGLNNAILQCPGDSIGLNPNANDSFNYAWSSEDPEVMIDENAVNPMVSILGTTTFNVTITDPNDPDCVTETFVNVLVPAPIELDLTTASEELVLCSGDSVTLSATTSGLEIQWIDPDGNVVSNDDAIDLGYEDAGIYTVVATNLQGCQESVSAEVVAAPDPAIEVNSSTGSLSYCTDESVTLNAASTGQTLSNIVWSDANGNAIGQGDEITLNPIGNPLYSVAGTNEFGCPGLFEFQLFESEIEVNVIGENAFCAGVTSELTATGTDGLTYSWGPDSAVVGANDGETVSINPSANTSISLTATNDAGCTVTIDYPITVFETPEVIAFADPEEIVVGQSSQLDVTTNPGWSYEWLPALGLDNPNIPNPVFTASDSGSFTYTAVITTEDGCVITDTITITVRSGECTDEYIFVPNMFTPNGDTDNDQLEVYSNVITEMNLVIYDRWGEKIISMDLGETWDGTYEGKVLPPDVYGYCINAVCIDGEMYTNQGNITLIR